MDARITIGVETAPGKVEPDFATFTAGGRFRLRYRVTTEVYLTAFRRQTGNTWQMLGPEQKLSPHVDTFLPAGEEWFQFPPGEGHEQFALALGVAPLPELAGLKGTVPEALLEKRFLAVETNWRPNGIRRYVDNGLMTTIFFGEVKKIAMVLRLPLFYR